jgi:hypothetical protein
MPLQAEAQCYNGLMNDLQTPSCVECGAPCMEQRTGYGTRFYHKLCRECFSLRVKNSMTRKPVGTKTIQKDGYVSITIEREDGYRGQIAEHRLVMEQRLGRPLQVGESVHHINGIRNDNRPENLELWIGSPRYGQRARQIKCPHCGKAYI